MFYYYSKVLSILSESLKVCMYLLSLVYHYSHHLGTDIYIILEVIVSLLQHVKEIPLLTNIVILIHFNPFNRGRK